MGVAPAVLRELFQELAALALEEERMDACLTRRERCRQVRSERAA